ncbi:hypothetical protein BX616_007971 [Lobosporangium transversale]|nr:hypothetical protein BX616_007971 [Lobosporangium transversale]
MNNNTSNEVYQQQQNGVHLNSQEPHSPHSALLFSSSIHQEQQDKHDAQQIDTVGADKGNGKGKGKGKAPMDVFDDKSKSIALNNGNSNTDIYCDQDLVQPSTNSFTGQHPAHIGAIASAHVRPNAATESTAASSPTRSNLYAHSTTRSSNSSSLTSLSSVEEGVEYFKIKAGSAAEQHSSSSASKAITDLPSTEAFQKRKSFRSASISMAGSGSGSGPSSSHPRIFSTSAQCSYPNGASSSSSGSSNHAVINSGSGSSSKPILNRALTGPATFQHSFAISGTSSSVAPPMPSPSIPGYDEVSEVQDFSHLGYDALPADFDFGDLPFYDTDPRTGTIYGDPYGITRPYLNPAVHFDLYQLIHDKSDPRKTNIFNKYGALLYCHPGRHIGQEQDSLRSLINNQPIWTMAGRTSTWGTLTATEMATKRQIKLVMESNKKKAGGESNEPLARFVFRWKEDDFVVEYRKQKDQYRITCSQMCGGESKWKPPQPKHTQTMFHGMGMESAGIPHIASTIGTPSPFDPTRYLQLVSEYRLNSGPVQKRGDFELYNPDTFPAEFRTFLMLVSIVVLDIMRPVDDKAFYKEFPEAMHLKSKVKNPGGIRSAIGGGGVGGGIPITNAHPSESSAGAKVEGGSHSKLSSTSSLDVNHNKNSNITSSAGLKSAVGAVVDVGPPTPPTMTRSTTLKPSDTSAFPTVTNSNTPPPPTTLIRAKTEMPLAPVKKSRWGSFFKK